MSRRGSRGAARRLVPLLLGAALAVASTAASAQEPRGQERACTLVLEPATDSTRSTAIEVADGQYVTHVGNGLRWTCGDATMYADSAVKYDRERRLRAIGSVDYRDSLRTLTADTLTYHEAEDRLVAEGRAVLHRRFGGSTLSGPRIVFLRAASGADRRTVATGRPHMTVRRDTAAGDTAAPTGVDADRIVVVGRDEVRSWGDVVMERPDMTARADSAFFFLEEEEGRLHGSPVVEGPSFTLAGRTIHTGFAGGELQTVEARDSARATGEGFELYADTIRARMDDRQIERLWAHGEGRSVALAPPYRLVADSLTFRFEGGKLDTLRALVGAEAVEIGDSPPEDPLQPIPLTVGERSWLTADTLVMSFARDTAGPPEAGADDPVAEVAAADTAGGEPRTPADTAIADTTGAPVPPTDPGDGETRVRRVRAMGSARAYRVMSPQDGGSDGRALHYQLGRTIVIEFDDGEAVRVEGHRAIGMHLDPMPGATPSWPPGSASADTAAGADSMPSADSARTPSDSAASSDTASSDTVPAPPDSAAGDTLPPPGPASAGPAASVAPDPTAGAPSGTGRTGRGRAAGEPRSPGRRGRP